MTLFREFVAHAPYRGGCLSIGNFDGVHLGHRVIIHQLVEAARQASVSSCILTFDPHPLQLLRPESLPPRLTTIEQRADLLGELGVDHLIAYHTDSALLNLSPEDFFKQIVVEQIGASALFEGPNFFFGKNRSGNIDTLKSLCQQFGVRFETFAAGMAGERMISSTEIRRDLGMGDVASAAKLLGRCYEITGVVESGAKRGRQLGFPTANLHQVETMIPADGVYAAFCQLPAGDSVAAAVNIGPNPTFGEHERKVEAHLLDFQGDLYSQSVSLEFIKKIRGVMQFDSADDFVAQLNKDLKAIRLACEQA